ncbi:murein DD-endopeptidase MepM/ murein hydrolase activator NlpD [Winogradskyella eximia]|jgi:murein DD-endopeptidase MepM/ murein hydrolase activator NlpD|uniref:Murein DD-endopeptidase MepM/ murein hydrolase activator NlpD n=1 Tax=Winogradskyella eximia TaxID=262006 RepID=A0A3D9HB02_9FLAO|nr:M23 family metallopeptidase [Winogradskyella eximia]RED46371.1 murein DD-endopeptidase MepM/ murein hydrolase activator NlpD [Winogradskyella eximia]|tara:strand:+ start:457 stop:1326 length:870 start_codon:yes stop_codon:yes gene_type:complete
MAKKKKKEKKFTKKLLHKYRLVILNEDTFEERFAIKLTRLNVFILTSLSAISLVFFTVLLIAFTPLREYIPGYSSSKLKKKATILNYKTDSLVQELELNKRYYASIRKVLTGDVATLEFNRDSLINAAKNDLDILQVPTNREDSLLREKIDKEDKYNLFEVSGDQSNYVLFSPVNGTISEGYNLEEKHYAVDIVVPVNTPVKATTDGTVIFAEWTVETGYVVIIEHNRELISVYKHNSAITKTQGDLVKAGEVIAMSGNAGELTTGPHLHFELWSKGYSVNPTNFINFE